MNNISNKRNVAIGDGIKRFRMERLWTLHQLASGAGLSAPTICRLERGRATVRDLTVAKLLKAYPDLKNYII